MNRLLSTCILSTAIFASVSIAVSQQRAPAQGGRGAGGGPARGAAAPATASADWPTFGGDNTRTNANMASTRITAANVASMVRQQVTISAPIDAGLIYLRGVQVNGTSRDVFFGTTNLGRTVAIDANEAKVLWEFAPGGFDETSAMNPQRGPTNPVGAKQITNSTPVADANRQFIYAASADGKVVKISIADGKAVWSAAVTTFPKNEKMDSPLSFVNGKVLVSTAGSILRRPRTKTKAVNIFRVILIITSQFGNGINDAQCMTVRNCLSHTRVQCSIGILKIRATM